MGGTIGVKSSEGEGSCFWFEIPVVVLSDSELKSFRSQHLVRHPTQPARARVPRVLVAEDNPINRLLAVRMLEKAGCDVTAVDDGHSAVTLVTAQKSEPQYDVVFMDCQMPTMDGWESTKCIREFEKDLQIHIPIVALTGRATDEDRKRCLDAGMDDCLIKPIVRADLIRLLSKYCSLDSEECSRDHEKSPEVSG